MIKLRSELIKERRVPDKSLTRPQARGRCRCGPQGLPGRQCGGAEEGEKQRVCPDLPELTDLIHRKTCTADPSCAFPTISGWVSVDNNCTAASPRCPATRARGNAP